MIKCLFHGTNEWVQGVGSVAAGTLEVQRYGGGSTSYFPCGPSVFATGGRAYKIWCWDPYLVVDELIEVSRQSKRYVKHFQVEHDLMMFAFQIEATRVMCLSGALVDGDHAIKVRVLRMLV